MKCVVVQLNVHIYGYFPNSSKALVLMSCSHQCSAVARYVPPSIRLRISVIREMYWPGVRLLSYAERFSQENWLKILSLLSQFFVHMKTFSCLSK